MNQKRKKRHYNFFCSEKKHMTAVLIKYAECIVRQEKERKKHFYECGILIVWWWLWWRWWWWANVYAHTLAHIPRNGLQTNERKSDTHSRHGLSVPVWRYGVRLTVYWGDSYKLKKCVNYVVCLPQSDDCATRTFCIYVDGAYGKAI